MGPIEITPEGPEKPHAPLEAPDEPEAPLKAPDERE